MFDLTILIQYFRYWGREPVELDREAIKRYLTTDESWLQHRWMAIRRKLQFPFSISFHDGPYRGHEEVIEGVEADEILDVARPRKGSKDEVETSALLAKVTSPRSYGTH